MINIYKKLRFPVIIWNKKHLSKENVPVTYTQEKMFFAVTILEGLWVVSFQSEQKSCSVLWSVQLFFGFSEKRRPNKHFWCKQIFLWL